MKPMTIIGLAAGLLLATPATAQDAAVEAPIKAFADSLGKGDFAGMKATHVATGAVIVDDLPPYMWSGTTSFADWGASLGKDGAAKGITEPSVSVGAPTRTLVSGDRAYVVAPATYTFKLKGVAMREPAQITFALVKTDAGWKIASWTWTGQEPSPAK